jgi:hypothetical protein
MRRLWKALPLAAAAAALAPAAAGAATPPPEELTEVDQITPGYLDPVPDAPQYGVLGAKFTIRAVDADARLAGGGTLALRVDSTGSGQRIAFRDPAAGVDLTGRMVVRLAFGRPGHATLAGVGQNAGRPVSFTLVARQGPRPTVKITLSSGYSRTAQLVGRLRVG